MGGRGRVVRAIGCLAVALAATAGGASAEPQGWVLALNWQPAFCERNPDPPECGDPQAGGPGAAGLALHGLWPQPRTLSYCGGARAMRGHDRPAEWHLLPEIVLEPATRAALEELMPGTRSFLDRHEWVKHGSCAGIGQEAYFRESVRLVRAVGDGPVGALLAERVGAPVTLDELRAAFDMAFGPGSGDRVAITCVRDGDRVLIADLRLNLAGPVEGTPLPALLAAAPKARPGCRAGVIDAPGPG